MLPGSFVLEVTGQSSTARPMAYGNAGWSWPDRDGWGPDVIPATWRARAQASHTAREMAATLRKALAPETTGQVAPPDPPVGMTCPAGTSPTLLNGQWSCQQPLVDTHPIVAVLIVGGFCVLFLGALVLHFIFPA